MSGADRSWARRVDLIVQHLCGSLLLADTRTGSPCQRQRDPAVPGLQVLASYCLDPYRLRDPPRRRSLHSLSSLPPRITQPDPVHTRSVTRRHRVPPSTRHRLERLDPARRPAQRHPLRRRLPTSALGTFVASALLLSAVHSVARAATLQPCPVSVAPIAQDSRLLNSLADQVDLAVQRDLRSR